MLNIGQFFERIRGKQVQEIFIRTVICDVLAKEGIITQPETIIFSGGTAKIQGVSSSAKSQLFIKKQSIIAEINSKQSLRTISDIT